MSGNLYEQTARYYDLDPRPIVKEDLAFYERYANIQSGTILELACGTGRVLLHLAQKGYDVTGIDLSEAMLSVLHEKLAILENEVQKRVRTSHQSMTMFSFDTTFSLITIPFRSFQVLHTRKEQKACLTQVHKHLAADGRFILHVFRPYRTLDKSWSFQNAFSGKRQTLKQTVSSRKPIAECRSTLKTNFLLLNKSIK
ncbi:class I SAM-dependent methyltransferase [Alteribacter populi]|uniref:class I SAM-dependent methyltransferase n=1 Tax=Alteribacter populi TaxID=2011011 RepID=UPI000BBA6215|nr:class I SAM-dependent methyltransferase [Alteribacter populi]